MRAVVPRADWAPSDGDTGRFDSREPDRRIATRGNLAWRTPRFAVEDRPDPAASADVVVIRVRACGICGSDVHLHECDGHGYMVYPGMVGTPVTTGHEFSATVAAIGPDVVDVAIGDPVCAEEIAWCGECLACRSGLPNNCTRLEELGSRSMAPTPSSSRCAPGTSDRCARCSTRDREAGKAIVEP